MATKEKDFDPFNLGQEELSSETSAFVAALAGVASGIIKIPEGVVSLGAELIDLGLDTNTAADVEKFFDKINPFEEVAQQRAAGKITEALTQLVSVGTAGAKIGVKLADKALKAKKAGNYANLTSRNVQKAVRKATDMNKAAGKTRFVAGVLGGAAGETFVADVEGIGTLGDVFEAGPTQLEEVTDEGGKEDAAKKLLNRLKFGSESVFLAPIFYGIGKGAKAAATVGRRIEFSNNKLNRAFNKIFSAFRARGAKPQEIFEAKMAEQGAKMADTNRAMELVKDIDGQVNKMFPAIKSMFDKSSGIEKQKILKEINDAMFSGKIDEAIPPGVVRSLDTTLTKKGLDEASRRELFGTLQDVRDEFTGLITASSNAPKDVAELKSLLGERAKDYLSNTYRIFEDKSIIPFMSYKPTAQAMKNAENLFKRYSEMKGTPITDQEATEIVKSVLRSVSYIQKPGKLPFFSYVRKTAEDDGVLAKKFFKQVVQRDIDNQAVVVGEGSKVFRELFGKMDDPRFSIYNGMGKLSSVARRNELLEQLARNDEAVKRAVTPDTPAGARGFFFTADEVSNLTAMRALPYQGDLVKLDDYLAKYFTDDFVANPLQGLYTTKDIAQALGDSQQAFKFLFEPRPEATGAEKAVTWFYRNLVLFPKAVSQVAKTILSPVTHFRNLFSATAFSGANGIYFENPKVVAAAFKEAFKDVQALQGTKRFLGKYTPFKYDEKLSAQRYRDLLRLGVVNSQTNLADIKNLLKDVRYGENLNIEKPLESMGKKLISGTGRVLKKGQKFAEDLYTAEDDLFKIANFAVERYRLKNAYIKAGREFTEELLDQEAADIVRNTVPNYAYVSDTVRALRRLPLGNFMSFPSEIIRTSTNIASRAIKEIKDPALRPIGLKRLFGMSMVTAGAPYAFEKGFQALYGVTNEQLAAMRRYLPEWSKNSTILPIKDEETGELKYIDFSHGNAYDTVTRPFNTLLINVQQGIENEDVLMKGLAKGIFEAAGELAQPFVSEAIYTEAALDIIARGGRTREGKQIYTQKQWETEPGTAMKNIMDHLAKSMMPFSYPQLTRIYDAALDKPSARSGEFFELPDELAGLAGFRAVKLDPVKAMGYKINAYQRGLRESRGLFTGGEQGLLKGGPKTSKDVIERYIAANKALFETQQIMLRDIKAAETLGTDMDLIRNEFNERQLGKDYSRITGDTFKPYFPSADIQREFRQIEERTGVPNPFEGARDVLDDIRSDLQDLSFDDNFDDVIRIEDYLPPEVNTLSELPPMPMPSTQILQQNQLAMAPTSTGLTPTEQALLSEEEKAIRLRQRGLA